MHIMDNVIFTPTDLVNLGFKECPNEKSVYNFLTKGRFTTVVLTDYNWKQHIFFINPDLSLTYFKPFIEELDHLLFELS
ncbi:hypothetical protein [Viridibacillus arvi]|uniref:hypothetical protein n=1 Tax=Viridibacillus arvi TaxID=263475 RepID=UPI0034CECF30